MEVTITIKDKMGFDLKIRSKSLMPIVALNKILAELKDIETLDVLLEQGKQLRHRK